MRRGGAGRALAWDPPPAAGAGLEERAALAGLEPGWGRRRLPRSLGSPIQDSPPPLDDATSRPCAPTALESGRGLPREVRGGLL